MPRHRRGWAIQEGADSSNRHTPLKVSMLEPVLLILLKAQPGHGYTLLGDLESLNMGSIHPSVIYRTLREMEGLGWIESDWDTDQTQGPPRRMYCLTFKGENVLLNWQKELKGTKILINELLNRLEK